MVRVFSFCLRNFLILNLSPILLSIEWFTLPLPPEHWVLDLTWKEEDVSADQERQRAKEGMERGGERAGWVVGGSGWGIHRAWRAMTGRLWV